MIVSVYVCTLCSDNDINSYNSRLYRLFWFVILIVALGLFSYMLSLNVIKLTSFPVSVDVNDDYQIPLEFPAVTICNENKFRLVEYNIKISVLK